MRNLNLISDLTRGIAIGAAAFSLWAAAASAAAQDAFAIGTVPADITSIGPRFAEAAGTFASNRIKVEIVTVEGGSRGVQVLLSGKLQAMHVGFSVAVNANREGADLRLISSSFNVMPMEIYVSPTIKSPADLKGQKIAISALTSESDMAISLALRQWNMTRKDVVITQLGGASQRLAAQLSGQVAAAPYLLPTNFIAREKGLVRLLDLGNGGAPWIFNGLVVNREFAKSNPDLMKRFIKANVEGMYKALSDEKWAKEVIAKEFKSDSKALLDEAYAALKRGYPRDYTPSIEGINNVIAEVNSMGPPLTSKNPADYVDLSILDALKKEGFFEEMKKRYGI